jgi:hypothetical protein
MIRDDLQSDNAVESVRRLWGIREPLPNGDGIVEALRLLGRANQAAGDSVKLAVLVQDEASVNIALCGFDELAAALSSRRRSRPRDRSARQTTSPAVA